MGGRRRRREVGLGASVLGVVLAVALSPLLPVGLARIADPSPGVHADLTALAVGVLVTLSAAVVIGALAAFRAARVPAATPTDPRSRLSRLGRLLPPPVATGMRMAVAPAVRGGGGGWRAFAGIATVAASFVGILGLNASFRHLLANPQLSGATWDAAVFYYESLAEAREGAAIIEQVPEVDAVARGMWFETTVDGHLVYTLAQEVTPALRPAITSGRLPREVDEIVVGERMLAALDLDLGERAVMAFPGVNSGLPDATPQTVRVVGTVVLSSPVFGNVGPGEGALISLDLARRWYPDIGEWAGFLLRFAPGIVAEDGLAAVNAAAAPDQGFTNQNRGDISMLRDVEQVPQAVAGMLAVLTAITLVHHLFATTRAHRREVAALRTLGLTRPQLLGAGAVQGATVAAATLVVAVPLGVLLSRLGWRRLADYLIVVPDTPVLIGVLVVVACALLVGAVVAGIVIVRSSCRASPGATLRAP